MGTGQLRLSVLRPLAAHIDGREVGPGPDSVISRLLLTALALRANYPVSKSELVDILWDKPPPSARNLVEKYVSVWRRAIGPAHLETVGAG
ncbi:winged helix-turn-helix domain-containing protein, partial [Mycobacterium sp.]|uniref:winged helix-turn-helix domain-containing protein n=1 Tax=Mycobacterium sp. TaxID=1785 RepID=UPI003BB12F71